jgi:hypothetical protein
LPTSNEDHHEEDYEDHLEEDYEEHSKEHGKEKKERSQPLSNSPQRINALLPNL